MQRIFYNFDLLSDLISSEDIENYRGRIAKAEIALEKGTGVGKEALGWLKFPEKITETEIENIISKAVRFRKKANLLLCIGIGGSFLGAKAGIEFLSNSFDELRKNRVLFSGNNFNSDHMFDLLELLNDKEVVVNVISKSGTNTEPSVSFRIIKEWMEKRYGKEESAKRIIATTDSEKGSLLKLAKIEGYETLTIPQNIGGRYSVLTPVGLFPFAFSGIDIRKIIFGANEAMDFCSGNKIEENLSSQYAMIRNILFKRKKRIETLAVMQPHLHYLAEWWKQLAGESEGKNLTGIFPSILNYTADLHSLGQWMQEGTRNVFETFVTLKNTSHTIQVPSFLDDIDEFNYLAGKSMEEINNVAYDGTRLAHHDGNVPVSTITLEDRTEETLGQIFYFFQKAIALSGYLFNLNPFDQPGVEAYKNNMYALLLRPSYENEHKKIRIRMKELNIELR